MKRLVVLGLALAICSGCATKTVYNWGSYEDNLYGYYKGAKTAEEHEHYLSRLLGLIEETETTGRAVPPGIYAEYGYGLFQVGQYQNAMQYFEKEKSSWAEAAPLMDRMIGNVRKLVAEKEQGSSSDN